MVSTAWKEYLIKVPTDKREYRTVEIYHPQFSGVLRFVQDYEDQVLKLESTAPRNPSVSVNFTASTLTIKEPGEKANAGPVLIVNMGAVGNEVQNELDNITDSGFLTPIEVIYRRFYEGDTSGPVLVYNLSASELKFESYKGVAFTARDIDFVNRPAGEIYTLERFPGLVGL